MAKKAQPKSSGGVNGNGSRAGTGGVLPKLKEVYEFMTQNNLEAVELDEPGTHLRMVRRKALQPAPVPVPVAYASPEGNRGGGLPSAVPSAAGAASGSEPHQPASGNALPAGAPIKSTMMGIFYRAPSPSSPPFVKEGDTVKAGHVLCMIEAMKVFNEIKAEHPCTVVKVLLENGKPVKLGQDLFIVQRA